MSKKPQKPGGGEERRRAQRTDILDTFSLFVAVPQKGPHRLKVHDVSRLGIGFDIDIEEESGTANFNVAVGQSIDLQFYLNQSLSIPLTVRVRRVQETDGIRRVGAEFAENSAPAAQKAIGAFVALLEALSEAGSIS